MIFCKLYLLKIDRALIDKYFINLNLTINFNYLSFQNIAGNLGYDSVNAFVTMFKKALGQSPTKYFSSLERHN